MWLNNSANSYIFSFFFFTYLREDKELKMLLIPLQFDLSSPLDSVSIHCFAVLLAPVCCVASRLSIWKHLPDKTIPTNKNKWNRKKIERFGPSERFSAAKLSICHLPTQLQVKGNCKTSSSRIVQWFTNLLSLELNGVFRFWFWLTGCFWPSRVCLLISASSCCLRAKDSMASKAWGENSAKEVYFAKIVCRPFFIREFLNGC